MDWIVRVLVFFGFLQVRGPDANWVTLVAEDHDVSANIVYKKSGGLDQKVDVISARDKSKARLR